MLTVGWITAETHGFGFAVSPNADATIRDVVDLNENSPDGRAVF